MKFRLIKLLAGVIGGCSWLALIGPILIWEYFDDRKWRLANNEDLRRLRPF